MVSQLTRWDTSTLPVHDQFGYWHEVICKAFVPLTPRPIERREDFPSIVETRPMVRLNRAMISSRPQVTRHGPAEVAATDGAYYFVNLQLKGRCRVRHLRSDATVEQGQFVVLDTTRPYHLDFDQDWQMASFRVSHADLDNRLLGRQVELGRPIASAGIGAATVSLMSVLWDIGDDVPGAAARELEMAFASATVAALAAESMDVTQVGSGISRAVIMQYVRAHLTDPNLSVRTACSRFLISPRTLHKVFEGDDETFAAEVRRLRMELAADLLGHRAGPVSVSALGRSVGFADPSSFSRAFRRHFGVSPYEYARSRSSPVHELPSRAARKD